jgi:hypothetical protein
MRSIPLVLADVEKYVSTGWTIFPSFRRPFCQAFLPQQFPLTIFHDGLRGSEEM